MYSKSLLAIECMNIEDDTLCRPDADPTNCTTSSFWSNFKEKDAMFLEFSENLNTGRFVLSRQQFRSNHGRTMLLDQSSLINIEARDPSRFYNDNTSSLSNKVSQLTMWSYSRKHTFEMARLFCRPLRMHIMKLWNSSLSLSQRILNHSLERRYVRSFWVGD
ncbi:NBS-LRR type resistance protein [Cucumis melo var. makuwa]|uniref:NBS-LRR type resistance protein n=1 Tax=Cucumis melo var. makuwa TaxID=1194695 RepID=A0A5A7UBJ7_CUCMM|nr:NBS-LRR type resistance protein [Cucumis melo var. makuwa]TYK21460.1 NBS-LRR type resistance protein [Cucumis melo var. makuwa]